jgi:hypothetical protein
MGSFRGGSPQDQSPGPTGKSQWNRSRALALLTNAVMAWNTTHMQRAVGQIETMSGDVLRAVDLRRIVPTYLEGINWRGTFDFPITRYADRILPSLATGLAANERRLA